MGSSVLLSQKQKIFQLRLIFGLFFLLSLLYALFIVGTELQLIFFGSTAKGFVVYVSDAYSPQGYRITSARVDYEYFDTKAKISRRDIYWISENDPRPTLGQTLNVQYVPGVGLSCPITTQSRVPHFWLIIPPLILGGLLALSFHRENAGAR